MLKIAVTEQDKRLDDIIESFPAQLFVVPNELIQDLIRAGKVDIAFIPVSPAAERKYAHRIAKKFQDCLVVCSPNMSVENELLLEALLLRFTTALDAENKYLMRMVSSLKDADNVMNLLNAACFSDLFVTKSDTLVRYEAVTEHAAYYDILVRLREAGARQISLIPIEKYY